MKIVRESLLEGAKRAKGTVVIIDVFRAFTCVPIMFHLGASDVILEKDPKRARELKERLNYIFVGEKNEIPLKGSDMGNSPYEIMCNCHIFKERGVVHCTTAGVNGVWLSHGNAKSVFVASFINAKATCEEIKRISPSLVTLVAMGERGLIPSPEDESCLDYMACLLEGKEPDLSINTLKRILDSSSFKKFLDPTRPYLYPEDPIICLQRDLIPLALEVKKQEDYLKVVPVGR